MPSGCLFARTFRRGRGQERSQRGMGCGEEEGGFARSLARQDQTVICCYNEKISNYIQVFS